MDADRPDPPQVELLRRERDQAIAHARALEHEMGRLRGEIKRLERALWRWTARRRRFELWRRRMRAVIQR